jgi:hypothetical protein
MGISRPSSALFAAAVLTSSSISAQSPPTLEQVLDRMGAYLTEYESQLSSVVADERFEQNIYALGAAARTQGATLESEVAFIRLPGGAEWLGFRDVKRVNFKAVKESGPNISDVLTSAAGDMTKARAIANASAKHNLGLLRTINVPTAPLHVIHPAHRAAHRYELAGDESVRGTRTMVVTFTEVARPTLVREPNGDNLVSSGRIWIDPGSGAVWRVEWIYQLEKRHPRAAAPPRLRVDFERHPELGCMVPRMMTEVFATMSSRTRGEGRATYRNFRRFGTSARIVPQ